MLGIDLFAMLAAVSAVVVGFAFMINIACSSWVNGLLLILVRRPYDVGDRFVAREYTLTLRFTASLSLTVDLVHDRSGSTSATRRLTRTAWAAQVGS
jgi:small-conductance mechanosensitive channel